MFAFIISGVLVLGVTGCLITGFIEMIGYGERRTIVAFVSDMVKGITIGFVAFGLIGGIAWGILYNLIA